MGQILKFLFARLKEPSTYAGMAAVAVSVGHPGGAELIHQLGKWVPMVLGAVAIAVPEMRTASDQKQGVGSTPINGETVLVPQEKN